jgi:hypothetical protein
LVAFGAYDATIGWRKTCGFIVRERSRPERSEASMRDLNGAKTSSTIAPP